MKKVFLLIFTFALTNIAIGQTYVISGNPTFDSVIVAPNNLTINDSVNFFIYMSTEAQDMCITKFRDSLGNQIHNVKISNDSIYIYEYSMWPLTCSTSLFIDTIQFSNLILSQYKVVLINMYKILMWPDSPPHYIDTAEFNLSLNINIDENMKENNLITIYPNPTTGKIKINSENIKNMFVVNQIGTTILKTEKTNEVDLDNFPKGIYFIKVITDKFVYNEKIILQ
jgi:hypothetical protein